MNLANCRAFGAASFGAFCLFWLAGCSHSITVEGRVPTPLIDPLPVSIGVITQPSFNQYVHSEKLPRGGGNWQIEVGELNQTFFKTLLLSNVSVAHAKLVERHAECGPRVLTGCPRDEDPRSCGVFNIVGVSFSVNVENWRKSDWSQEVLLVSIGIIYFCIQHVGNVQKDMFWHQLGCL